MSRACALMSSAKFALALRRVAVVLLRSRWRSDDSRMRSEGSCPPTAARTAYPRTHARRGSGKGLDSAAGGAIADGIAGRASLRALEIRCRARCAAAAAAAARADRA